MMEDAKVTGTLELERNPFIEAVRVKKRLKLLLFGPSGSGKTQTALRFPRPAVIDMEHGSDLYGDRWHFDVTHTSGADELAAIVDWLAAHPGQCETIVIDPITIYWEALQKKWSDIFLLRRKGAKGYKHEFYEMSPTDWSTLKSEWYELLRVLLAIDCNIVVTAAEKTKYKDNQFMISAGVAPDAEKHIGNSFDVILRLYVDEKSRKHMAEVVKDRDGRLPQEDFELTSDALASLCAGAPPSENPIPPPIPMEKGKAQALKELLVETGGKPETLDRVRAWLAAKWGIRTEEAASVEQIGAACAQLRRLGKEKE